MPIKIEYSADQISKFIELHNDGLSYHKISELNNTSAACVYRVLRENNVKFKTPAECSTKIKTDNSMFDKIDVEWKAYYLGLLFADGCMSKQGSVILTLSETDKHILDELNTFIFNSKRKLAYIPSRKIKNKTYIAQPKYTLVLTNKFISAKLQSIGLVPKKSLILDFPKDEYIPENLFHHFVRGYFDGDGWIWAPKKDGYSYMWGIVSSNLFIEKLKILLEKVLRIELKIRKSGNVHLIEAFHKEKLIKIKNYLYKDSTIYLRRKRENFDKFELWYNSKTYKK